jgi:uracil phosphoribosyltransferase
MSRVHVSTHPLLLHKLARLRDATTPPQEFRALVKSLSSLLAVEALADLETIDQTVQTPMAPAPCKVLGGRVALVPILRAGLGMADGMLDLLPEAEVWHIGIYRDEATLQPMEYYNKLPRPCGTAVGLVLDPMLATGGSAARACEIARAAGIARVKFVGLIAAPEGIAALSKAHPDVPIHVGAIDDRLNEIGYIVPGLGDAGDRQFGTIHHD